MGVTNMELLMFAQRLESLHTARAEIAADIKALMKEAGEAGFSPPMLRAVVKRRGEDPEDREAMDALLLTYCAAGEVPVDAAGAPANLMELVEAALSRHRQALAMKALKPGGRVKKDRLAHEAALRKSMEYAGYYAGQQGMN